MRNLKDPVATAARRSASLRAHWSDQENRARRLEALRNKVWQPEVRARAAATLTKPIRERFDAKWTPEPNSGCWLWTGSVDKRGYGQLRVATKMLKYASHVALSEYRGIVVGKGECACHHCDNPACVNPDHLFVGTQRDNMRDAARKGRVNLAGLELGRRTPRVAKRGEQTGSAKLTEADVKAIRSASVGCLRLARRFGVGPTTIKAVRNGRTWKHVL